MTSIMGIDSSTTGIAWTIVEAGKPKVWGKIRLDKLKTIQDKLQLAAVELNSLLENYKPDQVFIEKSIFVSNPATARVLSYIVGGMMTIVLCNEISCFDVEPLTWKSYFQYKNVSSRFIKEAKLKLGNTEAKKLCNTLRKSQTYNVIKHNFPYFDIDDDDIADACGIALASWHVHIAPLDIEISRSISIDHDYLASLGLEL